ncbi:hypothetical protein HJC23_002785 [Cyclotella cryptica]|uniref:Uncharacterized protein n=1 Tax=Cyclotella cryptica TaxID=29204 RepID=A0ABD3PHC7_9STRA|eukprot:CCRYP_015030-RA/>CCRYP_015030-RA protein AED:0.00 eAED:0.00 QI:251/-1/1/1/-1/1/1/228/291
MKQRIAGAMRSGVARRDKRTRHAYVGGGTLQADTDHLTDDATNAHQITADRRGSQPQCPASTSHSKEEALLDNACKAMQDHPPENHTATSSGIYQCLYQSVLHRHIRFQAPVFYMPSSIRLGVEYGLHFFEPRYRLLISEVMAPYPVAARRGQRIQPVIPGVYPTDGPIRDDALKSQLLNFLERNESLLQQYHVPTFIHAHQQPLRPNTPATIVQVRHCQIEADGRADVLLEPVDYIWLEQIWERPGTGGLIEARGLRMGNWASLQYELWSAMAGFGRGDGRGRGQMLPIP